MKDSVIDAAQILTVAKEELSHRLGALSPDAMAAVGRAIRISLGL